MGLQFTLDLTGYTSLQHLEDSIKWDVEKMDLEEKNDHLRMLNGSQAEELRHLREALQERDLRIAGYRTQIEFLSPPSNN